MKRKKISFWSNFRFKYKISVINENTLEEVAWIRISKLNGLSVFLLVMLFLFMVASLIVAFTPLRNYLPGYMDVSVRSQIVGNAMATDSLEDLLVKQQMYIANIKDILKGDVKADTVHSIDSITHLRADSLMSRTKREEEFRLQYEKEEKYNITNVSMARTDLGGLIFFSPVSGSVIRKFSPGTGHYGVDIAVAASQNVQAVLGGTVIFSGYTADEGYAIIIQHGMDSMSAYKHCGTVLKKVGEQVSAGEVIALTVSAGKKSQSDQWLHFELWHKGKAVNPENFISF